MTDQTDGLAQGPAASARTGAQQAVHKIVVPSDVSMVSLLGAGDDVLRTVERAFPRADVHVRGNEITVSGPHGEVALVERLFDELLAVLASGQALSPDAVERAVGMLRQQTTERPADVLTLNILSNRGRTIRPKTLNQKRYVDAIDEHTIVFGIGPAGTGKTYLAMAKAVQALQAKQVNRIILTRPAVEAGERLGFLPGTLNEKIDPYLRPLYDALHDMIDPETIPRLMAAGTIEVAPLAYMRGRTLNDAFIILDEAQNTTPEQMKMFLTRLGFGAKMVVTGDITQVDLPTGTQSGCGSSGASSTASRTSTSPSSPAPTSSGTGSSARSSTPTAAGTPSATDRASGGPPAAPCQRSDSAAPVTPVSVEVNNESGDRGRRGRDRRARPARARPRCGSTRRPSCPSCSSTRPRWSSCTSSGWTSRARRTCSPSRWTSCAPARTARSRRPACSATSCSARRSRPARRRTAGHTTQDELLLLTTHGILHLLGYDHAEPDEEREMFGLQRKLLLTFLANRDAGKGSS